MRPPKPPSGQPSLHSLCLCEHLSVYLLLSPHPPPWSLLGTPSPSKSSVQGKRSGKARPVQPHACRSWGSPWGSWQWPGGEERTWAASLPRAFSCLNSLASLCGSGCSRHLHVLPWPAVWTEQGGVHQLSQPCCRWPATLTLTRELSSLPPALLSLPSRQVPLNLSPSGTRERF